MDFVIANSADPDKITHRVAFHLGLPCLLKYPIRGYSKQRVYKGLHLLHWGTIVAMYYNGSNSL